MSCRIARYSLAMLILVVLYSPASSAIAQNPGYSDPSLEALVGNSPKISLVRVSSISSDDDTGDLVSVDFEVLDLVKRLKRVLPKRKPRRGGPAPDPVPEVDKNQTVSITGEALKRLRFYGQGYWDLDFTSPTNSGQWLLEPAKKDQTELLLFHDFQALADDPYLFVVPLSETPILLADGSTVASRDAILKKTKELVERYRGVKQLEVVLIDPGHFAGPLNAQAEKSGDAFKGRLRGFLVPVDASYEKLLIAQVQYPQYLRDKSFTTTRMQWRKHANDLYRFDSQQNRALFRQLTADPEIGEVQKSMLLGILSDWESNR